MLFFNFDFLWHRLLMMFAFHNVIFQMNLFFTVTRCISIAIEYMACNIWLNNRFEAFEIKSNIPYRTFHLNFFFFFFCCFVVKTFWKSIFFSSLLLLFFYSDELKRLPSKLILFKPVLHDENLISLPKKIFSTA